MKDKNNHQLRDKLRFVDHFMTVNDVQEQRSSNKYIEEMWCEGKRW